MEITEEMVQEASKLTKLEIALINRTTKRLVSKEGGVRPIVLFALCSHIAACAVRGSEGVLDKKGALDWIRRLYQD